MQKLKVDGDCPPVPAALLEPTDPAERERLLTEAEAAIESSHGIPHGEVRGVVDGVSSGPPGQGAVRPVISSPAAIRDVRGIHDYIAQNWLP